MKNPAVARPAICSPASEVPEVSLAGAQLPSPPAYSLGEKVATRQAYGAGLAKLVQAHPRVVALDGDMKNSTFSQNVLKVDKEKYIECFICEQNLVGVGIGVPAETEPSPSSAPSLPSSPGPSITCGWE